jgi:hypothetical protein
VFEAAFGMTIFTQLRKAFDGSYLTLRSPIRINSPSEKVKSRMTMKRSRDNLQAITCESSCLKIKK